MKHLFARWLISRSLDEGRTVPKWVSKLTKRDPALRAFERSSRLVEAQLRGDARSWSNDRDSSSTLDVRVEPRRRIRIPVPSAVGLTMAVAMLLTVSAVTWPVLRRQSTDATDPRGLSPADSTAFRESWAAGERIVARISPGPDTMVAAIPTFPSVNLAKITKSRVESASRAYGQTLGTFHRCMRVEQAQLAAVFGKSLDRISDRFRPAGNEPPQP